MPQEEIYEFQNTPAEKTDYKYMLFKYLRYWYFFVIGVILCLGLAFIYLRYAIPQYTVSSTLLLKTDDKEAKLTRSNAFNDLDIFTTAKNIDNEILVLKSKSLMQRVLTELSLHTSYYAEGRFKDREIYGHELPVKVIISKLNAAAFKTTISLHLKQGNVFELEEKDHQTSTYKLGQEIHKPYGIFSVVAGPGIASVNSYTDEKIIIKFNDIQSLAEYYTEELKAEEVNKKASVLTLSLTEPVAEKSKNILNKLIEVYNREAVEDKNLMAANTVRFIDNRLTYLTAELSDVEKNVEQYKRQNAVTDINSEAGIYREQISVSNKQLSDLGIQIDVLESIEGYLNRQDGQYKLVPSTLSIADATLSGLIVRFNDLQLERERLLSTNEPNSPLVRNINEQLVNLRANILENLANIKKGMAITRQNLLAVTGGFESQIQKVPLIERQLLEINRDRTIKQDIYLYLLQKREEAAMSLAATNVANLRIIDPAMAGNKPAKPNKPIILLVALAMGLGLPFATIFIKDMFNDKVLRKKDIEQATAVPVLGEIFHNATDKMLVVTKNSTTPIAEVFQLLRANLEFAATGHKNQVILITSGISGEGKSFFSLNLGASLALTGKKVAVLELDLRNSGLKKDLSLPAAIPGIIDYLLSDTITVYDLLKNAEVAPNLNVICAGTVPSNPLELMMHPRLKELIDTLKERFDHIILDTAPVGLVADAFSLAPYTDSAIFLVRYNYTSKNHMTIINDIHLNSKFRNPMIVLNDAKKENGYSYGYGYGSYKDKVNKRIASV